MPIEQTLRALASAFAARLVDAAVAALREDLRGFGDAEPVTRPPRLPGARGAEPRPILPGMPGEQPLFLRPHHHVDRLVEIVRDYPWPPRSGELQRLLGVKKDRFLRIVNIAMATGRIRRTGVKGAAKYFLGT